MAGTPNATNVRAYNRTYSYDKLGNIKSLVQSGVNGFTRDFVYNNNVNTLNKIQDASQVNIENYSYDANGNQLTGGTTRNYSWNHADQLISFSGTNVVAQYDYSGQNRVSKFVKSGTDFERTVYIDGVFEYHILEKLSATYEKNYVHAMDDSSRIAEVRIGQQFPNDISDSVVYSLESEIGSSTIRLDLNGTVIDREEYYPFGDSSLRTFTYKRYRYVGKERDRESGLYYYGARYYAAWTCRFVSVDPLSTKYANLSPYNYADNNPINDFDIDGMQNNNSSGTPAGGNKSMMAAPTGGAVPNNASPKPESTTSTTTQTPLLSPEAAKEKIKTEATIKANMNYNPGSISQGYSKNPDIAAAQATHLAMKRDVGKYDSFWAKLYFGGYYLGGPIVNSMGTAYALHKNYKANVILYNNGHFSNATNNSQIFPTQVDRNTTAVQNTGKATPIYDGSNIAIFNTATKERMTGRQTAISLSKQGFASGATAQLTMANGEFFVGVSSGIVPFQLSDEMTGILMNAGRTGTREVPSWFGGCAEVSAIQQARVAGFTWSQIRSATLEAYNIGGTAGSIKPFCQGCLNMLDVISK